jgi:hypothetical protein
MHILAAGLYGLLKQDLWNQTGGSIEAWLDSALCEGRLSPDVIHPIAAQILGRSVGTLWPMPH